MGDRHAWDAARGHHCRLNATIGEFERTNGAEMAVVVIRSLDGLSIEEAAVKLFELWKIGKEAKDNGLLLLWSTGDRRVRVEVGYGLEGAARWQGGGDSRYFT